MDLDLEMSPLQRVFRERTGMHLVVFLRKLEYLFHYLFAILALTCMVLPLVYDLEIIPLYITAVLASTYAVGLFYLRYKLHAHYAVTVHSGILLMLSSNIFLESGHGRVGAAMAVTGFVSVSAVFMIGLLWWEEVVVQARGVGQRPPAQPRERDAQLNHLLRQAVVQNPVFANGLLNNFDGVLADGQVGQLDLEGDFDRNPLLPNRPENNRNEDLEDEPDDRDLPNGHVVQITDDPDDPPAEGLNDDVVRQRLNVNDQVGEPRENPDNPQQREAVNEQVAQE